MVRSMQELYQDFQIIVRDFADFLRHQEDAQHGAQCAEPHEAVVVETSNHAKDRAHRAAYESDLDVGCVVELKSGGPSMTVTAATPAIVSVEWFDGKLLHSTTFPRTAVHSACPF